MLPARHRLTESADFRAVVRPGSRPDARARAGGPLLVVHVLCPAGRAGLPTRVGFVVSKAVGGAVTRNRTKRVLRHLVAARLGIGAAAASTLDPPSERAAHPPALTAQGWDVVVRAQPTVSAATTGELGGELDRLLERVTARLTGPAARSA